jgi:hypothetical protein
VGDSEAWNSSPRGSEGWDGPQRGRGNSAGDSEACDGL